MPNLEEHAATAWLADVRPVESAGEWPPAIRAIEATDDGPALLMDLGQLLDELAAASADQLSLALRQEPLRVELRAVLAQTGAVRALRVLHWITESDIPGSHVIVTALMAGDAPEARTLRATIATVTRRAALRRMFAPERLAALQAATAAALKETA